MKVVNNRFSSSTSIRFQTSECGLCVTSVRACQRWNPMYKWKSAKCSRNARSSFCYWLEVLQLFVAFPSLTTSPDGVWERQAVVKLSHGAPRSMHMDVTTSMPASTPPPLWSECRSTLFPVYAASRTPQATVAYWQVGEKIEAQKNSLCKYGISEPNQTDFDPTIKQNGVNFSIYGVNFSIYIQNTPIFFTPFCCFFI